MGRFSTICTFFFVLFLVSACQKNKDEPALNTASESCSVKAIYQGTHICHDGENAAAVELEATEQFLILDNFFEFSATSDLQNGDMIYVDFEDVDFSDVPPVLCGTLIVAPITQLTCITLE